jgi:acetyl esterase/lipase
MSRYVVCPHCGQRVGWFQRVEKCAISGELVCTKCIISSRFSDSIADKAPPEFREKFRFFNVLPFIALMGLILYIWATAWPSFIGWDTEAPDIMDVASNVISSAGMVIAQWMLGFILLIIAGKLPHLGTWMFYHWIEQPANRQKMDQAMAELAKGEYKSQDRMYNFKLTVIENIKNLGIKKHGFYYLAVGLNLLMIILFFIIRNDYSLFGSYLSAFAGWILVISTILNIAILWIAAAFYSKKSIETKKRRYLIELASWAYVILAPLVMVSYIFAWLNIMGLFGDVEKILGLEGVKAPEYLLTHQVLFVLQHIIASVLALYLSKLEPNFDWKMNNIDSPPLKIPSLQKPYNLIKFVVIFALFLVLIVIFVLSLELLFVDFAMAFCVISYILATVYFVVIFALLKLVGRKKKHYFRYKTHYWTLVKISSVILIINFLPLICTNFITNPDLNRQFAGVFGEDWRDQITPAERARLRQVRFSFFDAYFGVDFPIKAEYERVYMEDSPRFVKNRTNGDIISNGSTKFTNITQKMIFDAYLPATPEFNSVDFGDGTDVKFPVLIFMHGIGMDRGSGNANWTSQYFANLGFAVFDMSYGFTGWAEWPYHGGKEKGYDVPDQVQQIGVFTRYLQNESAYYHADLSRTYFAGRSFGGWLALACGYLAESDFAGSNFSSSINVKGVIPYYPASDIPNVGSDAFELGMELDFLDTPYIRGSSDPDSPDYNPEWLWYNPLLMINNTYTPAGKIPATFIIQGTHDFLVPQGAGKRLEAALKANGHTAIAGYFPFGSHGFDALHWSHYGQSILYYMGYFLFLTS